MLAVSTAAWWVLILTFPGVLAWFLWPGLPKSVLIAFLLPDIAFLIVIPIAWCVKPTPAVWNIHRYATHYATLVTLGLCIGSGGAWLGGLMMVIASCGAELVAHPLQLPAAPIEAKARTARQNLIRTFCQTAVMWLVFLLLLPLAVDLAGRALGIEGLPAVEPWLPWAVFGAAGSVGIYCGALFALYGEGTPLPLDTTTRFVVLGPYRFIRNPMAALGVLQGAMVGVVLRSWPVVGYALTGAVVWHVFAKPWEEADLISRFGRSYVTYRRSVRNWIPNLHPYPRVLISKQEAPDAATAAATDSPRSSHL